VKGEGGETGSREKGKDGRRREKKEDNKNLEPLALIFNQKTFFVKGRFCLDRSLT
jgi:hypothetical protein